MLKFCWTVVTLYCSLPSSCEGVQVQTSPLLLRVGCSIPSPKGIAVKTVRTPYSICSPATSGPDMLLEVCSLPKCRTSLTAVLRSTVQLCICSIGYPHCSKNTWRRQDSSGTSPTQMQIAPLLYSKQIRLCHQQWAHIKGRCRGTKFGTKIKLQYMQYCRPTTAHEHWI